MSVKLFSEIEAEFDLSHPDFERKWHGKKTKLAKMFWMTVCQSNALSTVVKCYDINYVIKAYKELFYRPLEGINWLRKHYVGEKTSEIKKCINFEEFEHKYVKRGEMALKTVLDIVNKVPISSTVSNNQLSKYPEIDIKELDGHHPELRSVSECLSLITISGAFRGIGNNILTVDFDLKRRHIKELNKAADEMVRSNILLDEIHLIKTYSEREHIFKMKTEVQGAAEALESAILYNPKIMNWSDKQIKYHIENTYSSIRGLDSDSVQKEIYRQRKQIQSDYPNRRKKES